MTDAPKRPHGSLLPQLIVVTDPKSPAAEGYRTVRTNLQFAWLDQPHRSIVITSASSGEGKTTTTANLGVVAAQAGSRVCLVDADLRRPSLHRVFGLTNTRGLSTALLENLPFSAMAQGTKVANLSVLTSGPLPPNPSELVGSQRMRQLLEATASDFDLVFCDTPPVISVADALALAAQCDGVILVVKAGTVPHEVVRRAAQQIETVKSRILGVLLNHVNLRRGGYYYDYYRYYHAYYGGDGQR
jgi:capsular exopolysaccharide synthesis family protein